MWIDGEVGTLVMHSHCTVTAQSLHSHCAVSRCTVAAQLLYSHYAYVYTHVDAHAYVTIYALSMHVSMHMSIRRPHWPNLVVRGSELHDKDIFDEIMRFELFLWNAGDNFEPIGQADGSLRTAHKGVVVWPVRTHGAPVGHCHIKAVEATEAMLQAPLCSCCSS